MSKRRGGLFALLTAAVVGAAAVFLSKKENRDKVAAGAKKVAAQAKSAQKKATARAKKAVGRAKKSVAKAKKRVAKK